jgi:hypothetical protein
MAKHKAPRARCRWCDIITDTQRRECDRCLTNKQATVHALDAAEQALRAAMMAADAMGPTAIEMLDSTIALARRATTLARDRITKAVELLI